jgi:hypothetical protein
MIQSGQEPSIKNLTTGEKAGCVVKGIGTGEPVVIEVGFEFTEPSPRFLRIWFAPSDWNARRAEAKRFLNSDYSCDEIAEIALAGVSSPVTVLACRSSSDACSS